MSLSGSFEYSEFSMSFLEWKKEFSVGIQSMDEEHQHMIELINGVYRELREHRDADLGRSNLVERHPRGCH